MNCDRRGSRRQSGPSAPVTAETGRGLATEGGLLGLIDPVVRIAVSFVIDQRGKVVGLHPGPVFDPGEEPTEVRCEWDFRTIRTVIRRALKEG